MAKTVFGTPGAGQNTQSGDAVAPGGVPGTGAGSGLAQKAGKTEAFAPPKSSPQPAAPAPAPQRAAPAPAPQRAAPAPAPQPAAPKPAMAAPIAKPLPPAPAAPVASGGNANRTMFGMPAVKFPPSGAPAPIPVSAPASPAQPAAPAAAPVGAPDAYMPTQLGMSALDPAEVAAAMPAPEAPAPAPAAMPAASDVMRAPAGSAPSSVRMPMDDDLRTSDGPSKGLLIAIIAGAALLFIAALLTVFFLFIKPMLFPLVDPAAAATPSMVQPAVPVPSMPTFQPGGAPVAPAPAQ